MFSAIRKVGQAGVLRGIRLQQQPGNFLSTSLAMTKEVEVVYVKKPEMKEYRLKSKVGVNLLDVLTENKVGHYLILLTITITHDNMYIHILIIPIISLNQLQ